MCGCTTKNSNSFMRIHIHWCQKKDLVNSIEQNSSSSNIVPNFGTRFEVRNHTFHFDAFLFKVLKFPIKLS